MQVLARYIRQVTTSTGQGLHFPPMSLLFQCSYSSYICVGHFRVNTEAHCHPVSLQQIKEFQSSQHFTDFMSLLLVTVKIKHRETFRTFLKCRQFV